MKKFLSNSIITVNSKNYLKLLMIIVPLLNFIPGFTFDLYTPSLPALSLYYAVSITAIKNTVTITLFGFALGGFISGVIIDLFGTRLIILLSLFFYTLVSVLAIFCHSIEQLMVIRFLQGLLSGAFTIGCRTIIVDNFKDHQFNVAILYTSLAFSLGPIIGPGIGGVLQNHLGWQANFIAYAALGFGFLLLYALFINDGKKRDVSFSLPGLLKSYHHLLTHKTFLSGIFLTSCCRLQLILYATAGAFLVQNILHHNAIVYGNTALLVGMSYFLGTLINRFLIKKYQVNHLIQLGLILLFASSAFQVLISLFSELNLFSLVFPIMMICFSVGFINSNLSIRCLKLVSYHASLAISTLTCSALAISALGIFLINFIDINSLIKLSAIFALILFMQLFIFYGFFAREKFD